MINIQKPNNNKVLRSVFLTVCGFLILVPLVACAGSYGSLRRDNGVQQAFETNQLPTDYKYYYFGHGEPYAIFGIDQKYEMNSKMWRDLALDTEEFKWAVHFMWEDYDYYVFGADILDPAGNKVGIFYSAIRETSFKFVGDNQIVVMPNQPFLWGPDDPGHGVFRAR